jgi:DNA-binding transcriptional LysR family regulator
MEFSISSYGYIIPDMIRITKDESYIGLRIRLRDLHVFATVAQRGSMAKAAADLGTSQPAVSRVIADLEHAVGARLFDRSRQGVELTIYGHALLQRGGVAFDALKQAIRDIEFLGDSKAGRVRIGCEESLAILILPPVVRLFSQRYPGVGLHVDPIYTPTLELPGLRSRQHDFILARIATPSSTLDLAAGKRSFRWVWYEQSPGAVVPLSGALVTVPPQQRQCAVTFIATTTTPSPTVSDWRINGWAWDGAC